MFRKVLICAMFATAAGYCFASDNPLQVVTSEVFYEGESNTYQQDFVQQDFQQEQYYQVPVWPLAGSDADVTAACGDVSCMKDSGDNIRIVSKVGDDLIVENNFNLGVRGDEWSGGANLLHGTQIPAGFDDECANGSEMPLLHREMLEDDGGTILTVSRSGRKNCANYSDGYALFMTKNGYKMPEKAKTVESVVAETTAATTDGTIVATVTEDSAVTVTTPEQEKEIAVTTTTIDVSADAEPSIKLTDQVRSWVVAEGQTLREVLKAWCDKEGWDLVWSTPREYPIQASAVFKGRFVDVASALVRNFGRATPVPYAKFYKGNRVLVISTNEE